MHVSGLPASWKLFNRSTYLVFQFVSYLEVADAWHLNGVLVKFVQSRHALAHVSQSHNLLQALVPKTWWRVPLFQGKEQIAELNNNCIHVCGMLVDTMFEKPRYQLSH